VGFVPGVVAFVATLSGLVHHLSILESKRRAKAKLAELEQQAAEEDAKTSAALEEGGKHRKREIYWEVVEQEVYEAGPGGRK
jgi:hypothetical protein